MATIQTYQQECNVYPGGYTPLPEIIEWQHRIDDETEDNPSSQVVDINEFSDHFILTIPLGGVLREDILVYVHDEVISLVIIDHGDPFSDTPVSIARQRHIRLPDHIATGFVSASYRGGLLRMYVPKATKRDGIKRQQVVVY